MTASSVLQAPAADVEIIGVFPAFGSGTYGGVQAAGREAWRGIVSRTGEQRAYALQYELGTSKAAAVLRAIRTRKRSNVILVWHLHLLKLLPFLGRSGSRVAVVLHGVESWVKHDRVTTLLLKAADLILSDSHHTWTKFLAGNPSFDRAPHQTVYLGLGSPLGTPNPAPADAPVVLMVSRLDKGEDYKGHRQMIAAWALVLERRPDAQLWIVGDGDLRRSLEAQTRRLGLEPAVQFFGQVSDVRKEELIGQCRCLALPSRGEGFGLVYAEAMRMGRPCLVSHVDAGREVVNPPEAGLAIDPDDAETLAEAVHRLLTPGPEWKQWSERARERYETHFTAAHYHQRLLSALFDS